jgi:hypothetical protein
MRAFLRRHLVAVSVVAALGVALSVFVAVWFQPQRLVTDQTVREALPTAASAAPEVLARGMLGDRAHHASGDVRVLRLADGTRVVRLEGLDVENGPDLYVTLAAAAADAPEDAFDRDYVSLGRLKGNKGDQTYALPAGLDLARFRSLVIWCERFSVAFGTASLA